MATNGMEIKVGADVGDAVKGIQILTGQFERLQKLASLPNLSFAQQERLNAMLLKTQGSLAKFQRANELANQSLGKIGNGSGQATQSLVNFGRVVQDAPFGIIGIANNIDPLLNSFQQLKASTGSSALAFKALGSALIGPAGIAVAVSAITSLLVVFAQRNQGTKKAVEGTTDAIRTFKQISDDAAASTAGQAERVKILGEALANSSNSYTLRANALNELQKINKTYFNDLSIEKSSYEQITAAVNEYAKSIYRAATVKGLEDEISQATKEQRRLLKEQRIAGTQFINARDQFTKESAKEVGKAPKGIAATNTALLNLSTQYDAAKQKIINSNVAVRENDKVLKELKNSLNSVTLDELKFAKSVPETTTSLKGNTEQVKLLNQAQDSLELSLTAEKFLRQEQIKNLEKINALLGENKKLGADSAGSRKKLTAVQELNIVGDESGKAPPNLENIDKLNEKLLNTKDLIDKGLNAGIDTFYNAIANNQDPLKSLVQSLSRVVTELGLAVVKAFLFKAIMSAISAGTSDIGGDLIGSFAGKSGAVRGSNLALAQLNSLRG